MTDLDLFLSDTELSEWIKTSPYQEQHQDLGEFTLTEEQKQLFRRCQQEHDEFKETAQKFMCQVDDSFLPFSPKDSLIKTATVQRLLGSKGKSTKKQRTPRQPAKTDSQRQQEGLDFIDGLEHVSGIFKAFTVSGGSSEDELSFTEGSDDPEEIWL
eukprot:CAMPEP_0174270042 /NCGR_PEP_ID=MMETSP0439-20130205/43090_1 /TAXON_ID=0 /ORGANISM="Stereomyxa ramosa, Strain Chinc5" /LENGTH=155 /DNA_ID=CAMNT_0015359133 /DNA_START=262 /DNA_END=729 /DNA_ORIENTATION=-